MIGFLLAFLVSPTSASPFRVLVFPHHGSYPIPQGRESTINAVTVTSDAVCNQYAAKLNENHEWEKTGNALASAKSFSLNTKVVNNFYFECTSPFKVNRESALISYSYDGNFVALIDQNKVQIVNLIEPESYVQGVVPAEVGNEWPEEALKAQAVAARTFSWWHVIRSRASSTNSNYDLDDTVQYQAYLGTSNHTAATDGAVSSTNANVMKYQGKVIQAYFSADSGGKSESSENAFGVALPYCVSKTELYDLAKTDTAWTDTIALADISKAFGIKVKSIEILPIDVDDSGRVANLSLTSDDGKVSKIEGTVFRQALKLRSTLFQLSTVTLKGLDYAQLSGKGFGHGVGLAQIGAKEYAQMGWTFEQIVKFYYTGITLEPVTNAYFE